MSTLSQDQLALLLLCVRITEPTLDYLVLDRDPYGLPLEERNLLRDSVGSVLADHGLDKEGVNLLGLALERIIDILGPRAGDP